MEERTLDINEKIVTGLDKLTHVHRILLWDIAKKEKISPVQIQFLIFLNTHRKEFLNVSSLAMEFDLTKATVSEAISTLEDKGLITKIQEKEDKRSYFLKLTAKGKKAARKVEVWRDTLVQHVNHIEVKDKEKVMVFLMELIKSLFDAGIINIARVCITCDNFKAGSKNGKTKKHYCFIKDEKLSDKELNIGCQHYKYTK